MLNIDQENLKEPKIMKVAPQKIVRGGIEMLHNITNDDDSVSHRRSITMLQRCKLTRMDKSYKLRVVRTGAILKIPSHTKSGTKGMPHTSRFK